MGSEVRVYKLTTAEEVISRVGEENEDTITLEKPRVVMIGPGPNGQVSVTLIPLLASDPDGDFVLEKSMIVGQSKGKVTEELEKGYLSQTSGLALV